MAHPLPRTLRPAHRTPEPRTLPHPQRLPRGRGCRHCGAELRVRRRRDLCRGCYRVRLIREAYPVLPGGVGAEQRRAAQRMTTNRKRPRPTQALPGTEEKILIMQKRAGRRQSLFHPGDARIPLGDVPELLVTA